MKIYVYIDESGSIHKNSGCQYFAIGGYIVPEMDKLKVVHKYKKTNLNIKRKRRMSIDQELKGRDMTVDEKIKFLNAVQHIEGFLGSVIIFNKPRMAKKIEAANIFFNYGVKLLFKDTILPVLPTGEEYEFILSIDNRNVSVGDLKDLEKFLNTEFCYFDYKFNVKYYDSSSNYGVQLADLIVNTMYMRVKDREVVALVLPKLLGANFRVNQFPGHGFNGRNSCLNFNESSDLTKVK